ncbi:MAG: hypothetical protein SPI28_02140, partial [Acetatifactor sp.]|nr:hypothetical protein [Acetatifactor sp.]
MEKESEGQKTFVFFLGRIASWNLRFKVSASLRAVQGQRPLDVVDPVIRMEKESEGQKTFVFFFRTHSVLEPAVQGLR